MIRVELTDWNAPVDLLKPIYVTFYNLKEER